MKKISFFILTVLSFLICLYFNYEKINIPYFGGFFNRVEIDITYKNNIPQDILLNDKKMDILKINNNHYLYSMKFNYKADNIKIKNPNDISKIILYIDKTIQYPAINSIIKLDNNKTILEKVTIALLSYFYNFQFFILSYIFLFFFLKYLDSKGRGLVLGLIFLGLIFRVSSINKIPFWDDEIYVLMATAPYSPILALFNDPGNPPLYFIFFKIYRLIFNNPDFYRFSSVLIGLVFNYSIFCILKKLLNKKIALIALFYSTFSIILIYFSHELRCYMLLMLLALFCGCFLLKNKKIPYLISTIALIYTHFYGFLFFIVNAIYSLCFQKNKKSYFIVNLIIFISYIPLVLSKITSLSSDFNSWIMPPSSTDFIITIKTFLGSILFAAIFIALLIYVIKKSKKRTRRIIFYSVFMIIGTVFSALIFSYTIKPIFCYKYFYILYPYFIILFSIIASSFKFNLAPFIIFILFIAPQRFNYQSFYLNHNIYLDFIKHDINKKQANYIFMTDTVEGYQEFLIEGTKPIYVRINSGINTINPSEFDIKKPCNCYIINLYLDNETYKQAKNIELYKSPLGIFAKVEY